MDLNLLYCPCPILLLMSLFLKITISAGRQQQERKTGQSSRWSNKRVSRRWSRTGRMHQNKVIKKAAMWDDRTTSHKPELLTGPGLWTQCHWRLSSPHFLTFLSHILAGLRFEKNTKQRKLSKENLRAQMGSRYWNLMSGTVIIKSLNLTTKLKCCQLLGVGWFKILLLVLQNSNRGWLISRKLQKCTTSPNA